MSTSCEVEAEQRPLALEHVLGDVAEVAAGRAVQHHRDAHARGVGVAGQVLGIRAAAGRSGRPTRSSRRCRSRARAAPAPAARRLARSALLERARAARRCAATPPTTASVSRPVASSASHRARHQRAHDRRAGRTRPGRRAGVAGAGGQHGGAQRGLEAAEREVEARRGRPSPPGTRARGRVAARGASRSSAAPPGIAEAEQARALVERLAGGVVERLADHAHAGAVVVHLGQQGVAARRQQHQERRLQRLRLQVQRRRRGRAGGRRGSAAGGARRPAPWRSPARPAARRSGPAPR